jgi:hypothetical protein
MDIGTFSRYYFVICFSVYAYHRFKDILPVAGGAARRPAICLEFEEEYYKERLPVRVQLVFKRFPMTQ